MSGLSEVQHAAKKVEEWERRLEEAMGRANEEGQSLRSIAQAARLSHETVRTYIGAYKDARGVTEDHAWQQMEEASG